MDKIQTAVISVLGLSGALAFVVPSAAPPVAAPSNPAPPPIQKATNSEDQEDVQSDDFEEKEENDGDSDWGAEDIPKFGEPIGFGNTSSSNIETGEEGDEAADEEEEKSVASADIPGDGDGASLDTLEAAGLQNGSGGAVNISRDGIDKARKF